MTSHKEFAQKVFEILNKRWPKAKTELSYHNSFQFLLAVMLSAQTTDKSVNKALAPIFEENLHFSAQDLVDMGREKFLTAIRAIGLAPTKSRNAYHMAKILLEKFHGKVPHTREELESLPGVGRKTANLILSILAHVPVVAVDTHVARVSRRLGLVTQTDNPLQIERELTPMIPKKFIYHAHHQLVLHGRYICTSRAPKCSECPLNRICPKIGVP